LSNLEGGLGGNFGAGAGLGSLLVVVVVVVVLVVVELFLDVFAGGAFSGAEVFFVWASNALIFLTPFKVFVEIVEVFGELAEAVAEVLGNGGLLDSDEDFAGGFDVVCG